MNEHLYPIVKEKLVYKIAKNLLNKGRIKQVKPFNTSAQFYSVDDKAEGRACSVIYDIQTGHYSCDCVEGSFYRMNKSVKCAHVAGCIAFKALRGW